MKTIKGFLKAQSGATNGQVLGMVGCALVLYGLQTYASIKNIKANATILDLTLENTLLRTENDLLATKTVSKEESEE